MFKETVFSILGVFLSALSLSIPAVRAFGAESLCLRPYREDATKQSLINAFRRTELKTRYLVDPKGNPKYAAALDFIETHDASSFSLTDFREDAFALGPNAVHTCSVTVSSNEFSMEWRISFTIQNALEDNSPVIRVQSTTLREHL
jgi:hypothetical protein